MIYGKLDAIEKALSDQSFIRIHNRYLINSRYVEQVASDYLILYHQTLPFSRSHKKEAIQTLARYMVNK